MNSRHYPTTEFSLQELQKESRMGSIGTETQREIRMIDLSDFEQRKYEIADQLWSAAIEIGFFRCITMEFQAEISIMPLKWPSNFCLTARYQSTVSLNS